MSGFAIYRSITLTQGKVAWVDQADYGMLSHWKWCTTTREYACRGGNYADGSPCNVKMHRQIMLPDQHQSIDHINGNGLDNRRENLRICTPSDNAGNGRNRLGTSAYKGVSRDAVNRKWKSQITHAGNNRNLGRFDDSIDAALAYDLAALSVFGDFARPNFLRRT
jgi:hypothetical protein